MSRISSRGDNCRPWFPIALAEPLCVERKAMTKSGGSRFEGALVDRQSSPGELTDHRTVGSLRYSSASRYVAASVEHDACERVVGPLGHLFE